MKNQYIGLISEDNPSLVVGILGILQSGNVLVPLNPAYPDARLHFLVNDCRIRVLLSDRANQERSRRIAEATACIEYLLILDHKGLDAVQKVSLRQGPRGAGSKDIRQESSAEDSARRTCYVIYTSGSTGRPKGVSISHGNAVPLLNWFSRYFDLGGHTRVLQNLSFSFDFGLFEILTTLRSGGTLFLLDKKELAGMAGYGDFIERHGINTLHTTPTYFHQVVACGRTLRGLRIVHFGGEALNGKLVRQTAALVPAECRIYNGYGPTEATINTSIFCLPAAAAEGLGDSDRISIGQPSARHRVFILDRYLRLQPLGVPGELCIAGEGLAGGYLNNPELTAERFVNINDNRPGSGRSSGVTDSSSRTLYRTGDLCRFRPDGNIEFLGRIDQQVKIRGFRIELEEIESCLLQHRWVREAVVLARDDNGRGRYLAAYIVPDTNSLPERDLKDLLRRYLSLSLPDYMIPAYFVLLDSVPVAVSGKVDRQALPLPGEDSLLRTAEYAAPRNEREERIAGIWQELLGLRTVGIEDDFFELGGDSILANRVIARVREEVGLDISLRKFFENPTLGALSEALAKVDSVLHHIPRFPRKGRIPLSFSQERLWFIQQLDSDSTAYHVPRALRVRGNVDVSLFEKTFTEIIRRHEIMRSVFPSVEGKPYQRILDPFPFKIAVLDWRDISPPEQQQRVEAFILEEGRRPFDLNRGPMLRVAVLKLKEDECILVSSEHHLVHDGWTQGVMLREFIEIYTAFSQGRPSPMPELPIQYADYALWQRRYMSGARLRHHLDFWEAQLADLPPLLELPTDFPRPPVISGGGELKRLVLPEALVQRLERFGQDHGVTLFMTMLTVFKVLLYRFSGVEDICIGTGIANRRCREMEGMLGMVINTLPLRTRIAGDMTFRQALQRVRRTCLGAYEYEETPFEKIVERLQPERSLSYMPVYQVLFSFMDTPTGRLDLPELEFEVVPSHNRSSKFDLNIIIILPPDEEGESPGEEVLVDWEYNTDLFSRETMARMISLFQRLLRLIPDRSSLAVSSLPLSDEGEMEQLLYRWNDTRRDFPAQRSIHEILAERTDIYPHHTALVEMDRVRVLTYTAVNRQAGGVARWLREQGVGPGTIVAIETERSLERLAALLGILKAGGAYLPVAPDLPPERQQYILNDSGAEILLNPRSLNRLRGDAASACSSQPLSRAADPAYVLYTSGSTGRPKGVAVEHGSVVNVLHGLFRMYPMAERDAYLLKTTLSFDISVTELFGWFWGGARLVLLPGGDEKDPLAIIDSIARAGVTHLNMVPSLFSVFIEFLRKENLDKISTLKYIFLGGEAVESDIVRRFMELGFPVKLENLYGPTEATVYVSGFSLTGWQGEGSVPIGRPLQNAQLHVLNESLGLQPIGLTGELCIGGIGVARGYLNNPELTAERFIEHRIDSSESQILYKTGDRARWLGDGNLEFLGRIDQQVKIRGFRCELGEIEALLRKYPGIRDALVVCRQSETGDSYLCAYIVGLGEAEAWPHSERLREYLARNLSDYMIPSYFVGLAEIPVTASGKANRRELPVPVVAGDGAVTPPADDAEERLIRIWADVLGLEPGGIGVKDNFFRLGGHSLKGTILIAKIHRELNVMVPLAELFKTPYIRGLAGYIRNSGPSRYPVIEPVGKREYYRLSSAQRRLYILQQFDPEGTVYNLSVMMQVEGVLDSGRLTGAFNRLIERHESLRSAFVVIEGQPVQRVYDRAEFHIDYYAGQQAAPVISEFIRPFDLSRPPLLRAGLIRGEPQVLMVDMHHIISDGISLGVMVREFTALYEGKRLPAIKIQYRDYTEWQKRTRYRRLMDEEEKYWLEIFGNGVPVLNLPGDFPRPAVQSFAGARLDFDLGERVTSVLKTVAASSDSTLFMVLLSVYAILLWKLSGQDDLVVGTPISGRRQVELQSVIGMFVNTLPLRIFPAGEQHFGQLLEDIKRCTLAAFDNQSYPFGDIVELVVETRDAGRNPLFDVMFTLNNFTPESGGFSQPEIPGLHFKPFRHDDLTAKFDLTFMANEEDRRLVFNVEYCTALFSSSTIHRYMSCFQRIVDSVLREPEQPLQAIEILSEAEKRLILDTFNDTGTAYPRQETIHRLFHRQSAETPHLLAGEFRDQQITYLHLQDRSRRLAAWLRNRGAARHQLVAVVTTYALEMLIGVLGILEAGAAYLPVNPDYPAGRQQYMLEESGAKLMLTNVSGCAGFGQEVVELENPDVYARPGFREEKTGFDDLAYAIYTSGSTGRPKGVLVTHRNVIRLVKNTDYVEFRTGERLLQTGALEFDASTFEIWGTLLNGLRLCLVPKEVILDGRQLKAAVRRCDITTMWLSAPLFNQLIQADIEIFSTLKNLLVGGDILATVYINRLRAHCPDLKVINGYGPTENTTFSTTFTVRQEYRYSIPIGKPVANSTAYVVDRGGPLQPVGVFGELLVGGDGVARGYLNKPEMTGEQFIHYPPAGTRPLYRTGDRVRWLPDGTIDFQGRIDEQIKIRGYRVELEEIERRIMDMDTVSEAVVTARDDGSGGKYLAAYVVPVGEMDTTILRDRLSAFLPDYMIPAYVVQLPEIPLTLNGKVDGKRLPEPEITTAENYVEPRTELEKRLAAIWSDILGVPVDQTGLHDNFFEMGGHSLKATMLTVRIHKELNVRVPVTEVFRTPTIEMLARYITHHRGRQADFIGPAEKREYYPVSAMQERMLILNQLEGIRTAYNLMSIWSVAGRLERERLDIALGSLIGRHQSLRTSFLFVDGIPRQRIHEKVEAAVEYFEKAADLPPGDENPLSDRIIGDFVRPFDLSRTPLLRMRCVESASGKYILMFDIHHIVSDGTSINVLIRDLALLYDGRGAELPPVTVQYKDFVCWQQSRRGTTFIRTQAEYWLRCFADWQPDRRVFTDFPRPPVQSFAGESLTFSLDSSLTEGIRRLMQETKTTLYMVLLAACNILLMHTTATEDVVIGTPVAGRELGDLENLIGMFVNVVALRNHPHPEQTVPAFLEEIRENTINAYENQAYPYGELLGKIGLYKDFSRNPLYDLEFVLLNLENTAVELAGLKFLPYPFENRTTQVDIALYGWEREENIDFRWVYCTDLYRRETMERWIEYFKQIVSTLAAGREVKLKEIKLSHELGVLSTDVFDEVDSDFTF